MDQNAIIIYKTTQIRVVAYVDDVVIIGKSTEAAHVSCETIKESSQIVGFEINIGTGNENSTEMRTELDNWRGDSRYYLPWEQ